MSVAFAELRVKHRACAPACTVANCHSRNCTAHLPRGRSHGIACDACGCFGTIAGEKKPDFVALLMRDADDGLVWFVIEMKSRVHKPGDIAEQLQRGAVIIESESRFAVSQPIVGFVPVLVKSRGISAADIAVLGRTRIHFKGKQYAIRVENCGIELASIRG